MKKVLFWNSYRLFKNFFKNKFFEAGLFDENLNGQKIGILIKGLEEQVKLFYKNSMILMKMIGIKKF